MERTLAINPRIDRLVCSKTGEPVEHAGFLEPVGLCDCCPAPGKPVEVRYRPVEQWVDPEASGLWRYGSLLPVTDPPSPYAPDVGGTGVRAAPTLGDGVEVWLKHEGRNPSGSFKDRGLAVAVALGVASGAERFCLPTQGNAGVAAALFSARMGLPGALVYMPEGHRDGPYHRAAALYGAEVRFHGANIAAAGAKMREDLADDLAAGRIVDVSTFHEPGRLEGKKTMGLEIAEQIDPLPDWILYPTGGGTGLVGIWKAFEELRSLGGLDGALPRMVAVQSERCAPVVQAFERGEAEVTPITSGGTIADGLDVPGAIMGHRILQVLRASGGTARAVSEEAIRSGWRELGSAGVGAGLEAAATLAALHDLRAEGIVAEGARVLLLVTSGPAMPLAQHAPRG